MEYYWNIHSINFECILNESLIFLVSIDILSLDMLFFACVYWWNMVFILCKYLCRNSGDWCKIISIYFEYILTTSVYLFVLFSCKRRRYWGLLLCDQEWNNRMKLFAAVNYGLGMDSVCLEFTILLPCDAPEWSGMWFAYCRRVRTWSSRSTHGLFLPWC